MRTGNPDDYALIKLAREMQELIAHPGWKLYHGLLEQHRVTKVHQILAPVAGIDEALKQNADKGAIIALQLARDLPKSIIDDAARVRKEINPQDLKENE